MTELEGFRDHARRMARTTKVVRPRRLGQACKGLMPPHHQCTEVPEACGCKCHDADRTVPTKRERALWQQLADEIDAYLADGHDQGDEQLFEVRT